MKGVKENYGCPPINPVLINKINHAADRIFFVRAKAVIEEVSLSELDRVVSILQSDTVLRLRIEGYTDSEGTDARNLKLSDASGPGGRALPGETGYPGIKDGFCGVWQQAADCDERYA